MKTFFSPAVLLKLSTFCLLAGFLVGGSIFVENPGYANLVGADATAVDARRAVLSAECLLDLRARAC